MSGPGALLAARETLVGARAADAGWTIEAIVLGTPDEAVGVAGGEGRRARAVVGRAPALGADALAVLLRTPGPGQPAPLYAGRLDAPMHPSSMALVVEELPAGSSLGGWWRAEPPGVRGLEALALAVAEWHASGAVVDGLHPELVFMERPDHPEGEPRITALVPTADRFWAAAPPADRFVGRCLDDIYALRPEAGTPGEPARDVFALAAIAWHRLTGLHPFGDERSAQLLAILAGRAPRTGGVMIRPGLRTVLLAGLDARPAARPSAAEIAAALRGAG